MCTWCKWGVKCTVFVCFVVYIYTRIYLFLCMNTVKVVSRKSEVIICINYEIKLKHGKAYIIALKLKSKF